MAQSQTHLGWIFVAVVGTASLAFTLRDIGTEVLSMEGQHWVMLLIAIVVGYVLGRIWTQPAKLVGLP